VNRRFPRVSDQDRALVRRACWVLEALRAGSASHASRVRGARRLADLVGVPRCLVGRIQCLGPPPEQLVVLGDLHGCFNTFRAALEQTRFFARAEAGRDVRLVCLGDYVNRGVRSFHVVRLALLLLVRFPERVTLLRGNHDEYHVRDGRITPAALPADWLDACRADGGVDAGFFRDLSRLFDALPAVAVGAEGLLLAHAGPPAPARLRSLRTLGDLDTPACAREMRWARAELARENAAPSDGSPGFGRRDLVEFMERLGVRTMIVGHRVVPEGAECAVVDGAGRCRLWTVSSMGGAGNRDAGGHYGHVTPCMLVRRGAGPFRRRKLWWERITPRRRGAG